jgi:hypothetical protein
MLKDKIIKKLLEKAAQKNNMYTVNLLKLQYELWDWDKFIENNWKKNLNFNKSNIEGWYIEHMRLLYDPT